MNNFDQAQGTIGRRTLKYLRMFKKSWYGNVGKKTCSQAGREVVHMMFIIMDNNDANTLSHI